jgi:chromosome segregation ATPase
MNTVIITVGLLLGSLMILVSIFVYLKKNKFDFGDALFSLLGAIFVSLSLWTSIQISIDSGGAKLELTKNQQEEITDRNAEINGKIQDLEISIQQIKSDISSFRAKVPEVQISKEELDNRAREAQAFKENSQYSVFVFYRDDRKAEADEIVKELLKQGYRSSNLLTDLSEIKEQRPPGTVTIRYTQTGQEKLKSVETLVRNSGFGNSLDVEQSPIPLRRGDIQVLLF